MPDKDAGTPRVFLYRHGETEWSKSGQYTGISEIELTEDGVKQVLASGKILVGAGKLIDPAKLARVFVSPRRRAVHTFNLAFSEADKQALKDANKVEETERLAEWGYGLYEGMLTKDIRALRKEHGLDTERPWDIWTDGCEEGESAQDVTDRLDNLIAEIRALHQGNMHGEKPSDVVLFAHGHTLRAFTKRWLGYPMDFPLSMMLEPGAVGVLSYQHHSIDEPAFLVGYGFPLEK
ncbi:histidine phosphatase family protein [Aspergillus ibericus CBS 121593]|uniref:Phosphoglycerate mutase n=1 Tax=Aspergillus ibericus CBS 121593 TaxID=1448316 RepID=A0A395H6F6_9EURO|nr:phosphoglycerate mutase [Aspergillus ibericus CBS 121593]RAL03487.1 phosphoglycerate mutase [Aspergillus ibericus CBS 121593]